MNEIEKMNAICFALIHACQETNAEEMKITQSQVHHKGEQLGDWEIIVRKASPDKLEGPLHENNLAQTWLGDIKKAFQKEQTRLIGEGITVRMKPVWQAIHDGIWAAKRRRLALRGNEIEQPEDTSQN